MSSDAQDAQAPGTPRGVFAADSAKLKPLMNAVHGHALATAALLVSTARSVTMQLSPFDVAKHVFA